MNTLDAIPPNTIVTPPAQPGSLHPACSTCRWGRPYAYKMPNPWTGEIYDIEGVRCCYSPEVVDKRLNDFCSFHEESTSNARTEVPQPGTTAASRENAS